MPSRRTKWATYRAMVPMAPQSTLHRVRCLGLQVSRMVVHLRRSMRTKTIHHITSVSIGVTRLISNSMLVSTLIDDPTIVRLPQLRKRATGGHSRRELFNRLTDAQMLLVHRHLSIRRTVTMVLVLETGHGKGRIVTRHLQVMTTAALIMAAFGLVELLQMIPHGHELVVIPRLQVTHNRRGHHPITELAHHPLLLHHLPPHHDHL